ncbi:MAG: hypothetical protein ACK4MD_02880 [Demequina sp.]
MNKRMPLFARIALRALIFAAIAIVYQLVASLVVESQPMWNTARVIVLAIVGALMALWDDRRRRGHTTTQP